jgi:hypothetical protein
MNSEAKRLTYNAPEPDRIKALNRFIKRTINITEFQPHQNLTYFSHKLKSYEYRSKILFDRIGEVLTDLEAINRKTRIRTRDGFGRKQ